MTENRLKTIHTLFNDCWKLFKEYHITAEEWEKARDNKLWDRCAQDVKQLSEKYGEEATGLICDTMELIEGSERDALRGIKQYQIDPPVYRRENEG